MFDFLKNAVKGIVGKISGKKEAEIQKQQNENNVKTDNEISESKLQEQEIEIEEKSKIEKTETERIEEKVISEPSNEIEKNLEIEISENQPIVKEEKNEEIEIKEDINEREKQIEEKTKIEEYLEKKPEHKEEKEELKKLLKQKELKKPEEFEKSVEQRIDKEDKEPIVPERKKIEEKAKPSIIKSVFSVFTGKIKIEKNDISDFLDEFEIQLVESDVSLEVAEYLKKSLESKLIGKEIGKNELKTILKKEIELSVLEMLPEGYDLISKIKLSKKPYKIIFFGPNGSGKTTTIAKVANMLKKNNLSVVVSASDTFRAAAIEQMQEHCTRLSIPMIKGNYQSDPSSVAFNTIEHAKAKNIDVVLIDTAGRLEIDTNLMRELEKIVRVSNPDIKIFIAESIMGNSIYDLVKEYNKIVGIDAAILTKLDLDAKGGVAISLYKATSVPIIFISTGQKYEEIEQFDRKKLTDLILSE